ncbi:hypothetical protein VZT92_004958 [Zoarces viviparus]|uniref:Uncharacterized protein n=1 Tax=Zoarces viviparus TaxID=48416 RepID=A0AAW1FR92_ZOAVI
MLSSAVSHHPIYRCSTPLGRSPWLQALPTPPHPPTPGGLPLGFLENHLPLSERAALPRNAAAAEHTGSSWP